MERCAGLKGAVALIVLAAWSVGLVSAREGLQPSDKLQDWIVEQAVTVRSIDAADEDFRDLEPLVDAIGSATVVQLGEPSHGAGSAFAAKVRLIKFLHERMGFDVIAWESGLYDVSLAEARMRSGDDGVSAAQAGIMLVWSATEEARPLLTTSRRASRPTGRFGWLDSTVS